VGGVLHRQRRLHKLTERDAREGEGARGETTEREKGGEARTLLKYFSEIGKKLAKGSDLHNEGGRRQRHFRSQREEDLKKIGVLLSRK